jgi:hypothetical protein
VSFHSLHELNVPQKNCHAHAQQRPIIEERTCIGVNSVLGDKVNKSWNVGLDSWILSDGNYPLFSEGDDVEFALEFYSQDFSHSSSPTISAELLKDGRYRVNAEVVYLDSNLWILDFGILAYSQAIYIGNANGNKNNLSHEGRKLLEFQMKISPGQMISADLYLGIDHFAYFERLCNDPLVPPLIYKWHLDKIEEDCSKLIRNEHGEWVYDKDEPEWKGVSKIDYPLRSHSYLLHCTRSEEPPHRDGQRVEDALTSDEFK